MTLWMAALIFVLALAGIVFLGIRMRKCQHKTAVIVGLAVLGLLALLAAGYVLMGIWLVSAM